MTPDRTDDGPQVAVAERPRPFDLALFAVTAVVLAATPWMLVDAGTETARYRDHQTGRDLEGPAWMGVLVFVLPLLAWAGMKAYHLIARPAAAVLDRRGARLYPEAVGGLYMRSGTPRVDLPWDEIDRMVVWRLRKRWLGCIPGWESRVGVQKTDEWHEVSQREPTPKQRSSPASRRDGTPVRLGSMLKSRSVRLSPRAARRLASAAERFAPRVQVADERVPGESRTIEPKRPA
ncbi:MAG TPA: hypothetical protein VFU12_20610 [Glycomyces sp.]|nr:hypothetical protein [Glycomyces sp.]